MYARRAPAFQSVTIQIAHETLTSRRNPSDALNVRNNVLSGEVVAGSGSFRVRNIVIWWQAE